MKLIHAYPALQMVAEISHRRKVKVYLVGGFWRDYFLNLPRQDFDFAVASAYNCESFSIENRGVRCV